MDALGIFAIVVQETACVSKPQGQGPPGRVAPKASAPRRKPSGPDGPRPAPEGANPTKPHTKKGDPVARAAPFLPSPKGFI